MKFNIPNNGIEGGLSEVKSSPWFQIELNLDTAFPIY